MSKVLVKEVRLSENPATKVVDHPLGINGKLNETEDGRLFCQIILTDDDLFKTSKRNMMYSSDATGNFPGASPKDLVKHVGKEYPGARVVTRKVTEYTIGQNIVNQYTTIVLPKENIETVFKNSGHTLQTEEYVNEATGEVVSLGVGA